MRKLHQIQRYGNQASTNTVENRFSKLHGSEVLNCREQRFLFFASSLAVRRVNRSSRKTEIKPLPLRIVEEQIGEKLAIRLILRHGSVFYMSLTGDR